MKSTSGRSNCRGEEINKVRRLPAVCLLTLMLLLMSASAGAQTSPGCAGSLDPAFNAGSGVWPPWAPTPIRSVTPQSDGKLIIAGEFTSVQGLDYPGIARLNADGSVDQTYVPNPADALPHTRVTQTDGKRVEIVSSSGDPLPSVVRFNTDATIDATFRAALPQGFHARALALQPDGKILVAGGVSQSGAPLPAEMLTRAVLRLNEDGSLDPTFDAGTTAGLLPPETTSEQPVVIYDMVRQADGRLYVGGFFTSIRGLPRSLVARLNADGTLDSSFVPDIAVNPGFDGSDVEVVSALALTPQGQLVIAGHLHSLNGLQRSGLARLHTTADGCPGIVEVAGFGHRVRETDESVTITLTRSGSTNRAATIIASVEGFVSGPAPVWSGYATAGEDFVAEEVLVTFAPGETTRPVTAFLLDDTLLEASQSFLVNLKFAANSPDAALLRHGVSSTTIQIYDDESVGQPGSVDESFAQTGLDGMVSMLALAPDGTVLAGGSFTSAGGAQRDGLARFTGDGQLVADFNPRLAGGVTALVVEPETGKVIIGGYFTSVNGVPQRGLARLHPDGSIDPSFNPELEGTVSHLAWVSNGQLIVAGAVSAAGGTRRGFIRLHNDGSLDSSFNAGAGLETSSPFRTLQDLKVQSDGKVLLCGWLTSFNGVPRSAMARLNVDGSVDAGFAPTVFGPGDYGNTLLVQPDGKILLSGWIRYGFNGIYHVGLLRFDSNGSVDPSFLIKTRPEARSMALQPDGKIIYRGTQRLNPDGTEDPSWFSGLGVGDYSVVSALLSLSGGDVLMGGAFLSVNGFSYAYLARLNGDPDPAALALLNPTWARDEFRFAFVSQSNRRYEVQYCDELRAGPWQSSTNLTGNGTTMTVRIAHPAGTQRFYRIETRQ